MHFVNFLSNKIKNLLGIIKLSRDINDLKLMSGKQLSKYNPNIKSNDINDYEFKVFSQFGEDGIIQYLVEKLKIKNKTFVEFGVENYEESNTRFLLENNNWKGLIIDSSQKNINYIKNQSYFWRNEIMVENSFIDKENINETISKNKFAGEIGLLSIDIDGNDYWIWDAINVIDPIIVICEFNARLGYEQALSIPYNKDFDRTKKHYSNIYYGASLNALYKLGKKKNYVLLGTNKNGNNAFFIKKEVQEKFSIESKTPKECYHKNSFSEFRNQSGNLIKKDYDFEKKILDELDFTEV
jgi:hypothetical protein